MADEIWIDRHHVNLVYEAIRHLTKDGETPVGEQMLVDFLAKQGLYLSRRELAKILLEFEILGYVSVTTSGTKREFQIKFLSRNKK